MGFILEWYIPIIIILISVIVIVLLLRMGKSFTSMRGYKCKSMRTQGFYCDVHRIPRGFIHRLFAFIIPLKRYSCHDCGKKFTRLQPLFEKNGHKESE